MHTYTALHMVLYHCLNASDTSAQHCIGKKQIGRKEKNSSPATSAIGRAEPWVNSDFP